MRAACRAVLEAHRRGWPEDEEEATKTLSAVRVEAAADLGVVLAPRDTPNEQLRGLREGWVHWFVGSPIVHPESGEEFAFDEEVGRIVLA